METIEQYLTELRRGSRDAFSAAHPHPFLLLKAGETGLKQEKVSFDTKTLKVGQLQAGLQSLRELQREGRRLLREAHELLIFEVKKRPGNPFLDRISIGRTSSSDITIPDNHVSKLHAHLEFDSATGGHSIIDAGSRNGTSLNGVRLVAGQKTPIKFGDLIMVGAFPMRFVGAAQLYDELSTYIVPLSTDVDGSAR